MYPPTGDFKDQWVWALAEGSPLFWCSKVLKLTCRLEFQQKSEKKQVEPIFFKVRIFTQQFFATHFFYSTFSPCFS